MGIRRAHRRLRQPFFKQYEEANEENVTDFLAFSTANASSIRSCFELARSNGARRGATALTVKCGTPSTAPGSSSSATPMAGLARGILALLGAGWQESSLR